MYFIQNNDDERHQNKDDDMDGSRTVRGRYEKRIKILIGKLVMKLRHKLGKIILKWILKECDVGA